MASSFESSTTKTPKKQKIRTVIRNAVEQDWSRSVTVPDKGELVYASDINTLKIGDGVHDYDTLPSISGGQGGTSDYNDLENKPSINNVTLSGNKSAGDLGFATVSTTGNYSDLINKPTLGTMAAESASDYTKTSSLSPVATSGSYTDLINKPTLGTASEKNVEYFATSAQGQLASTAVQPGDLATVATTGSYNDLSNKPTIPTVNNPTIIITQGGTQKGSFSLNQATGDTIALDATSGNVDSVNGKTGVVVLTADDVNAVSQVTSLSAPTSEDANKIVQYKGTTNSLYTNGYFYKCIENSGTYNWTRIDVQPALTQVQADWTQSDDSAVDFIKHKPNIPTKTSDLTNDSGYITGINSTDVTNALGYTPYNSTNPSGYQANTIETISVNGTTQQISNKNVNIVVPAQQQADWDQTDTTASDYIKNKPYIPAGVVVDQTYNASSTNAQSGTAVAQAVSDKVTANNAITGATHTKITYDSKGLVTAGTDLTASDIPDLSATYQEKLVSGTNIKTINEQSILGSGNITIQGGGSSTLAGLTDVSLNNPSNGQVLRYNGTEWVNGSGGSTVAFDAIIGSPYDNSALSSVLNEKQSKLTSENAGTDISITAESEPIENTVTGTDQVVLEDCVAQSLTEVIAKGKSTQDVLPSGYTRLDYVGFNGNTYLDTGIKFTSENVGLDLWYEQQVNTSHYGIFGAMGDNKTNSAISAYDGVLYLGDTALTTISAAETNFNSRNMMISIRTSVDKKYKYFSSPSTTDAVPDIYETDYSSTSYTGTVQNSTRTWWFGRMNGDEAFGNGFLGNLYVLRLWDNDELVFDGIPVKNSNNVAGLYDTVSKTFIGVSHYIPLPNVMVDGVTNAANTAFDTGIQPTVDDVQWEIRVKPTTDSWYILQARNSTQSIWGISGSSTGATILLGWNGNQTLVRSSITRDTSHIYYIKATAKNGVATLYVRDETVGTENTTTSNYTFDSSSLPQSTFRVFGNGNPQYVGAGNTVYYAKIYVGGELVLDYIPAKNVQDTAGFYDKVTNAFKTPVAGSVTAGSVLSEVISAGTTNTGPDIEVPLPVYANNGIMTLSNNFADTSDVTINKKIGDAGSIESTNGWFYTNNLVYVIADRRYIFYGNNKVSGNKAYTHVISWYDANKTWISNSTSSTSSWISATAPSNAVYARLNANLYSSSTAITESQVSNFNWVFKCVKSNQSTRDLQYVPYKYSNVLGKVETITDSMTTPNSVTTQTLLSVGNLEDTQNVLSGNLITKIGVLVLNGSEDWVLDSTYGASDNCFTLNDSVPFATDSKVSICTHYANKAELQAAGSNTEGVYLGQKISFFTGSTSDFDTVEKWRHLLASEYMKGSPVTIIYQLATSTTTVVAGQTLNVKTGDNTISVSDAMLTGLGLSATSSVPGSSTLISFVNDSGFITSADIANMQTTTNLVTSISSSSTDTEYPSAKCVYDAIDNIGSGLPSQTGHSGEFLTTDGTDASWAAIDALPSQSGQSGKFLTTNGTTASWGTVSVPTKTSDLTNDSGFITGITSSDVTSALGYTPYNSTNPNGYTSNVGTVTSVNTINPDANGNVTLSIPTVNDNIITVTQGGVYKGSFSLNQNADYTLALDGGSGSGTSVILREW